MEPVTLPAIHRVVTGHAPDGRAIVASDGPLPTVVELQALPGTVFHEVWSTSDAPAPVDNGADPSVGGLMLAPPKLATVRGGTAEGDGSPAPVDNGADPTTGPLVLPPPQGGTRIRFVDIPPDTEDFLRHGAAKMNDAFAQIGDVAASTVKADSPHPLMHRTQSVDYGIVIDGEMTLVLDDGEVLLRPGSVVVQRGTNHAWANRSGRVCRMLFVLVDGAYAPDIAAALAQRG